MIKSMTGYGRCESEIDGKKLLIEIRSVNHRYFEFSSRIPREYLFLEDKIKLAVQQRLSRGKIEVFISYERASEDDIEIKVNHSIASAYIEALNELSREHNINNEPTAYIISKYPDVLTVQKSAKNEELLEQQIVSALKIALNNMIKMRESEGENMRLDICSRTEKILGMISHIEERSPRTVIEYMNKLSSKIKELLEDNKFDEQRVITEVAVFADKVAVDEETVRLRSHIEQLTKLLCMEEPVGRKMDFLIQEMNREANTIGSKATDTEIAYIVVDIKSEIEKIREQVQNIE